jgi:aryl sulfotransferase
MDSARWNGFAFRDDDIVIATWAKSGTTWMQQIVSQLIFRGAEGISLDRVSPWLECTLYPPETVQALEAQTHRRFIKTHLPLDAIVFSPLAKYIYVARDGRDFAWSIHNHIVSMKAEIRAAARGSRRPVVPANTWDTNWNGRLPPRSDDLHENLR